MKFPRFRSAFTMLELIFVIVVMGILAKFGVELFLQTYNNYARSTIVNALDTRSEAAIQEIANRLSYRIKDSIIATTGPSAAFTALENATGTDNVIEWINWDLDGWQSHKYSGIVDLDNAATSTTALYSPGTAVSALPAGAGIVFLGANVRVGSSFGWHGSAANSVHKVTVATANTLTLTTPFNPGDDIFEYYQVASSASALVYDDTAKTITYFGGYQPWNGQTYDANAGVLLVDHVSTVNVQKVGDVIKIVLCLSDNDFMNEGAYSICKTKVVF